jgi:glycosyltransferase involved in cell wall biosynthesis
MYNMVDKLLVVVVLYKKRLEDSSTYRSLQASLADCGQQAELYVYDNSPAKAEFQIRSDQFRITYISDTANSGISKAYNAAAAYAMKQHKEWLLLFDQDSNLPLDYFDVMSDAVTKNDKHSLFVPVLKQDGRILSPCRFRFMKGSALKSIVYGPMSFMDVSIFNSGILVSLALFNNAGGYNEAIKLDFSDHYFINQVKKVQNEFVVLPVSIQHELSSHTNDEGKITSRFKQYCGGVRAYGSAVGGAPFLLFWTFLRSLKLTLTFRNPVFIGIFITYYILKNKQSDAASL